MSLSDSNIVILGGKGMLGTDLVDMYSKRKH